MKSWMGWLLLVYWHLLLFHFLSSHSLCHPHDSFALLHFKNSFTIDTPYYGNCRDTNPKTATWENGTDCCSWNGVTCHPISGHVTGLDLTCSWLVGEIHPNSILFSLSHLQSLNLAFNHFYPSPLSSLFGGLVSLTHLNLSGSEFEGEIPSQISHLSKLQSLDLSSNQLKWKESTWKRLLQNATVLRELVLDYIDMSSTSFKSLNLSSSLVTLSLENTRLRGNLTNGNDILCLPNLQELHLSNNHNLQGQLPEVSCSTASLSVLDLSYCQFQGPIPPSYSNLTNLTSLDLTGNKLSGSIPSSLLTLPRLTFLNIQGNQLIGQIPNVFHQSNRFEELDLSDNYIGGELPSTLSNLQHLILMDLSWNLFSGQIPNVFAGLTKLNTPNLTSLDLSFNNLKGSIPSSLLTLPRLTFLNIQGNRLSGQIPNVFHQSNRFEELHLSYNNIGGELPSTLSNLQHLILLDLSQNKFEGPLPNKITGFSNLTKLRLRSNLLNGTIPSWCLSLPSLVHLDLSNNHFTGHISAMQSYSLESLYLCYNKLHGNIPESIFSQINLTHLCLSSNNLSGSVHFPLFSKLQHLEYLSLSHNNQLSLNFESIVNYSFSRLMSLNLSFMGLTEFPKLSGKVPKMEFLDLSNNKLNGRVPNWLHEISSLQYLDLSQNLLTPSLDHFSRNNQLGFLDLSFNSLTGDIPSSICNASSIGFLNLSHNKLTGIIPQCLANLSDLRVLDLQMNKLYGTLPSTFSNNNWLSNLILNGNQLQGLLPESLSNCTYLEVLNLGNNQIEDVFPHRLQTLPFLKVLVLRANKFHGPIASLKTEHGFPNLVIFDISSNNFSGPIPKAYIQNFEAMKYVVQNEVGNSLQEYMETEVTNTTYTVSLNVTTKGISMTLNKIPTNFVNIDLSGNKFEGEIPNVIGELHALKGLNLSHNRLRGPIPQSMGNLTNLESLDLSSNMFTGRIPIELTNLNFLEVLNLSHNHLVGEIPQGKQFDTFSNDSYEGNMGLCGVPLSAKCSKDPVKHSPTSLSFWREERFGFGWKPVAIGYGCGMVFGVGMGCCVLLTGKPQWLVRMVGGQLNKKVKRKTRMRTHENCSRMH